MNKQQYKKLSKLYKQQERSIDERLDKGVKCYGEKVTDNFDWQGLETTLNPENQDKMMCLYEFYDLNENIDPIIIFEELERKKYIELFDDKGDGNGLIICKKPFVDWHIKPYPYSKKGEYIEIVRLLVISKKVQEELQEFCNKLII